MKGSTSLYIQASPLHIWSLVSDVTQTGRFSPETFESQWLGGATGPAVEVRFRGHVRRNGKNWLVYWTTCVITQCEPGREFTFAVIDHRGRPAVTWSYQMVPSREGTTVTESFELANSWAFRLYALVAQRTRTRTNIDNMVATLERIKVVAERNEG